MNIRHRSCILFFLTGILFAPPLFAIELAGGKVDLSGQARFRYEFFTNTDFTSAKDRRDYVFTRFRPSLRIRPTAELNFLFQPQFTGGWGEFAGTSATTVNSTVAGTATSGALNDPALGLHQAWADFAPADWFSVRLGRQELAYGDHLVVGTVGWHNVGRSFDALKTTWSHRKGWVDLFWSPLLDAESGQGRGAATGNFGESNFVGAYSTLNLGRWAEALDSYALYRLDKTASPRPHNYLTTGVRLQSTPSALDYRVEGTYQYGKLAGTNHREYQADVEAGYTFEALADFRVGLEIFLASETYNQLFPTAHKWLGVIDLFGRRNIMGGALHLSAKPADQWTLKLDAHTMYRVKTTSGLFRLNGTTAIGGTGTSTAKLAGEEIDFSVHYQPRDHVGITAGSSLFLPMGFVKTEVGSHKPVFGYLMMNLTF